MPPDDKNRPWRSKDARKDNFNDEVRRLKEREARLKTIKERYSRYGNSVVQVILTHCARERGLQGLVQKLKTDTISDDEFVLHMALEDFLSRKGPQAFLISVLPPLPGILDYARYLPPQHFISADASAGASPSPYPAKDQASPGAAVPAPTKEGKTWPDVDRRSGLERRSGTDRRNELDIVWKNKRFGGERRSGKDRRKDWPDWAPTKGKKK
ncbi:MAG: hypothetical protein V2A74_07940 [bacterium]